MKELKEMNSKISFTVAEFLIVFSAKNKENSAGDALLAFARLLTVVVLFAVF